MKTSIRKIPAAVLLLVLCLTVFPLSAFAADTSVGVAIPVSVELSGETPSPEETYTFVLQAVDNAPMPEESTLKIIGAGKGEFPVINYSTPGIYCYTVTQQAGSHDRGHYDATVYYVRVSVTNGEYGGLEAVVAAHTDAAMTSEKQDMTFTNTYDPAQSDSSSGGSSGGSSGSSGSSSSSSTGVASPQTGDNANILLPAVGGAAAVAVLIVCCTVYGRRKKEAE